MVIKMDASSSCYLREEFEVLEMAFEVWRIFRNDQEESGAKGDNQEVTREKEALEKMKNMIFKSPNLQIGSPQALSISATHDDRRLPPSVWIADCWDQSASPLLFHVILATCIHFGSVVTHGLHLVLCCSCLSVMDVGNFGEGSSTCFKQQVDHRGWVLETHLIIMKLSPMKTSILELLSMSTRRIWKTSTITIPMFLS